MTLPVRLLGLVLTAVGLVVATTGLVLLVAPVVGDRPVAMDIPEQTPGAGTTSPTHDASQSAPAVMTGSPPGPVVDDMRGRPSPSPTVPPTAEPTSTSSGSIASPAASPQPSTVATADPESSSSPSPQPSPSTSSPAPASAASYDEDPDTASGEGADRRGAPCRDESWPWGQRRGSRGWGAGWGPPTRCHR